MRNYLRWSLAKKLALMAGLLVLTGVIALTSQLVLAEGEKPTTQKLVTVYDQGNKRVILTDHATVGEALKQAGIDLAKDDRVEPSRQAELTADKFNINIYRAQPVVIIDGVKRVKIMSSYRSARQIVSHAGLDFHPEDEVETKINFLAPGESMGVEYVVKRSKALNLVYYGKAEQVRTQANTVAEFLKSKNIKLAAADKMSLTGSAKITNDLTLEIWREGKQELIVEEPVKFKVEQIQDFNRNNGYREIKTPGKDGRRLVTYEVEIRNGQEVARRELASVSIEEAITQVEVIGMGLKYTGGGSKDQWLAAAGIPQSMWGYADSIVQRESGWNPNAVNRRSGACGLAQALPCSKVPGNPFDPVDSLRWMDGYVNARYGGWAGAYAFWQKNKWY